jgi:hypothetical protein
MCSKKTTAFESLTSKNRKKMKVLISYVFLAFSILFTSANAQTTTPEKAATHFFIVNLDGHLMDALNPSQEFTDDQAYELNAISVIIDSLYRISAETFKNELNIELLPLTELKSKIKYNRFFPNCPNVTNVKKVIKVAAGYTYYADFYVNIFSGITNEVTSKPSLYKIRPLYAFSFTLYDKSGKVVKKIDFNYKAKKSLVDSSYDTHKSGNDVKAAIVSLFHSAVYEFSAEYKKKLLASR